MHFTKSRYDPLSGTAAKPSHIKVVNHKPVGTNPLATFDYECLYDIMA
jgi:hypothetical protein